MSKISQLEALLAKVQARASEPRVRTPAMAARAIAVEQAAPPLQETPSFAAAAPPAAEILIGEELTVATLPEPAVESVSGEFEVAAPLAASAAEVNAVEASADEPEQMLELEELGPADELEPGETVVEVGGTDRQTLEIERISEPPASGRELVAAPHESARMAVATPATPDAIGIEQMLQAHDSEAHERPPESSRNLRASPAVPATSEVVELDATAHQALEPRHVSAPPPPPHVSTPPPPRISTAPRTSTPPREPTRPPPPSPQDPIAVVVDEPIEEAPVTRMGGHEELIVPQVVAAAPEPVRAAIAVQLAAPRAHARSVEHVVVGIEADVIRPDITPSEVAAFIGAVRASRPESFGALLDAALDL